MIVYLNSLVARTSLVWTVYVDLVRIAYGPFKLELGRRNAANMATLRAVLYYGNPRLERTVQEVTTL